MGIFEHYQKRYEQKLDEEYTLQEFLDICKEDRSAYMSASERLLLAIGDAEIIDTAKNPTLSRIFSNRLISRYPAFKDFYGMEDAIEQIVAYLKHSAQGLEESKQILYLLGPVGGGKSSLAEKLKSLMQKVPIYILSANGVRSPVNDHPFCLFDVDEDGQLLRDEFNIPSRYLKTIMSPWAVKRLHEFGGDISKFRVVKVYPSILDQLAIAKTEPGDENNQDISSLVGKVDIRQLEHYSQDDADAYAYSGALCRANQGIMEFVEMFKAPIKVLHPLLTATQEGNYNGTEGLSALPYSGIILAHSNESEWSTFKNNKNNEAFLDRVYIVKVPYCLRVSEELQIYKKLIQNSELSQAPCAPGTIETLAQFSVLSRLKVPENSSIYSKMRVYDGESLKDTDPKSLYDAILQTKEGGAVMTPSIALKTLNLLRSPLETKITEEEEIVKLTNREIEVLEQLSKGLKYNAIAENLFLSPGTIRKHVENIYTKLQVHNKLEAIQKAKNNKLI